MSKEQYSFTPMKYFESDLKKRQIEDLAKMDVEKYLADGYEEPLKIQILFKRLKTYVDKFLNQNENFAIDDYLAEGTKIVSCKGAEVQYIQGADVPDYMQDKVYASLHTQLEERKKQLNLAFRNNEQIIDEDTGEVIPKVGVKYSKKSSLTVRL